MKIRNRRFETSVPCVVLVLLYSMFGGSQEIRLRAEEFNDLELLFDMAMSDCRPLRECMEDTGFDPRSWRAQ